MAQRSIYVLKFRLCSHETSSTHQTIIYQSVAYPQLFLYKKTPIYTKGGASKRYRKGEKRWYIFNKEYIDSDDKLFKMLELYEITQ